MEPTQETIQAVTIPMGAKGLQGDLALPAGARGLVVFAHGSGSSRKSRRNRFVARTLQERRLGTLLFDLLTRAEELQDAVDAQLRFDIPLLTQRLVAVTDWVSAYKPTAGLRLGYFGASTGAAAALAAAAERPGRVAAVVSRGGRPDLAHKALARVRAPTLLIVGGADLAVLELNRRAMQMIAAPCELRIVPDATHLFEEPGALSQVAAWAGDFFVQHLHATAERAPVVRP
jgi:putative phosphoribosyl transferase